MDADRDGAEDRLFQRIIIERTGSVLAERAQLATDALSRMRGLLGRRDLPAGEAIILRPSSSIHTLFMAFAIDVIYVDRNDQVVKTVAGLKPYRLSAARRAHTTIEMRAGSLVGQDIKPGDKLAFVDLET